MITTAQSVLWADTVIRLIVKHTAQNTPSGTAPEPLSITSSPPRLTETWGWVGNKFSLFAATRKCESLNEVTRVWHLVVVAGVAGSSITRKTCEYVMPPDGQYDNHGLWWSRLNWPLEAPRSRQRTLYTLEYPENYLPSLHSKHGKRKNRYIIDDRKANYSIWIFTHLKLCLADAIHNFKWVKIIQIWQNGDQLFSNLAGWCHILSLTYFKCGT